MVREYGWLIIGALSLALIGFGSVGTLGISLVLLGISLVLLGHTDRITYGSSRFEMVLYKVSTYGFLGLTIYLLIEGL